MGLNVWGTPEEDVCEGYCPRCEREGGRHYGNCDLTNGTTNPTPEVENGAAA